jgi:hypothetical protein
MGIISVVRGTGISKQRFCVGGVSPLLSTRERPRAQTRSRSFLGSRGAPRASLPIPADVASRCVCARTHFGRGARLARGAALPLGEEAGRLCGDSLFPRAAERIRRAPHGNRLRAQGRFGPAGCSCKRSVTDARMVSAREAAPNAVSPTAVGAL